MSEYTELDYFKKQIENFQARTLFDTEIPPSVIFLIRSKLNEPIEDMLLLEYHTFDAIQGFDKLYPDFSYCRIKNILREAHLQKYYESIPHIIKLLGGRVPKLTPKQIAKSLNDYSMIADKDKSLNISSLCITMINEYQKS